MRPPAAAGEPPAPKASAMRDGSPPGALLRLAAMTYEAVLLFGVAFVTGYAVLALAGWSYPLHPHQRWLLQAALLVAVGVYFVYCWVRAGQTLAMKSWRLRLVDRDGRLLRPGRAVLRYLLAWTLFAPGLLFIAATGAGGLSSLLALAASVLAMLAFAGIGPRRQLLHDLLLGSRVIRE